MQAVAATIGVDIGTSATKGVLVGADGTILARASAEYPLLTPRPGWSEQHPEDWWRATVAVLRELGTVPNVEVMGIGLSGQMHGSVFLDAHAGVIRPALLWNDARTHAEVALIERRVGREAVVRITGNAPSAGMQAPKILWLQANEPDAYARIAHVLLPKDFIGFRLTGEAVGEPSDGSGTLLLDLKARRYSDEMREALGIPAAWLPELVDSFESRGTLTADAATPTGLPAGTPVVAGGGDNACAAIGAGIIRPGEGACSIGTSGTLFLHSDQPVVDPEGALNAFCAAGGGWHLMGVILAAGGSVRWFMETMLPGESDALRRSGVDPIPALLDQALAVAPGADGLVFLPYLAGERSPHMDPFARGAWVGLSLAHERRHLLRAVIEGVGFAFTDCLERMRSLGLAPTSLALVGGGARSAGWRRLLASQLATTLTLPAAEEGPALGAAILARVGVGMDPDLAAAVAKAVPGGGRAEAPDAELVGRYQALHERYGRLYPALTAAGAFA